MLMLKGELLCSWWNAVEAGYFASLAGRGKGSAIRTGYASMESGNRSGFRYQKLLKNWIQHSVSLSSAGHARQGRSSPSLSPRLYISWM
jgi:hypothetical protein